MNDLEVLVPADTTKEIIFNRLKDFKKWGLLNIKNRKIKLVITATDKSDLSFLKFGWPDGVEIDILTNSANHVAQRLYNYYHSYAKPDTARWYLRIDEDSINDIDGLLNNLDKWYDHEREYHLSGEFNEAVEPIEQVLLSSLGFKWWFLPRNIGFDYAPIHDHEISATSNAAMKRILNNEKVKTYFELRKDIAEGHGDQGLCYAALMVKIQPSRAVFVTREPKLSDLSIFGGHLNHIHHIGRDKNPHILEWLEITENNTRNDFINKHFLYSNSSSTQQIKLCENRSIEEISVRGSAFHIGIWGTTQEGNVSFYTRDIKQNIKPIIFENWKCREHNIKIL